MKLKPEVEDTLKQFSNAGSQVALVGGTVRDLLQNKSVENWDITTDANPQRIQEIKTGGHYTNAFGTVVYPGSIEVTTYRTEGPYSDSRHPDSVTWGKSLEEDLSRRDFTINAMALPYDQSGVAKTPVDPYGGQTDLKSKIIRTVGDPNQRFGEDALRLLRAIRFAATLGFKIEEKTKEAIAKNANLLSKISGERIRDELIKILESDNAADGIMLAKETGLLNVFLPELETCFKVEQKSPKRHHIYDVGTHCVESLRNCPSKDVIVRFATLLHDIGKAKVANVTEEGVRTFYNHEVAGGRQVLEIANRLHLSRDQREELYKLVRWHQFTVNENQTDSALRRFIKNIEPENIENMMDLRVGDRLGGGLQQPESWRLKLFRQRLKDVMKKPFTVADLKVSGHDVMKILNIKPGPKVGEVLNKLFEEVQDDAKKNNRDYLLERIKNYSF